MRTAPSIAASCVLPMLGIVAGIAAAQETVVIYRCTDASGALTVQNDVPCPAGSRQQKTVMQTVAPPPPPPTPAPEPIEPAPLLPAAPTSPEPPADSTSGATASSARHALLPPPALYHCQTAGEHRYLSETATPPRRCVPLQITGLGGAPATGAGAACRMTSDQCQPVADAELCEQWQQYLRGAESAVVFGPAASKQTAQAEVERIGQIVRGSTCSQ